jgi:hypothetical protein
MAKMCLKVRQSGYTPFNVCVPDPTASPKKGYHHPSFTKLPILTETCFFFFFFFFFFLKVTTHFLQTVHLASPNPKRIYEARVPEDFKHIHAISVYTTRQLMNIRPDWQIDAIRVHHETSTTAGSAAGSPTSSSPTGNEMLSSPTSPTSPRSPWSPRSLRSPFGVARNVGGTNKSEWYFPVYSAIPLGVKRYFFSGVCILYQSISLFARSILAYH